MPFAPFHQAAQAAAPLLLQEECRTVAAHTVAYRLLAKVSHHTTVFLIQVLTADDTATEELAIPLSIALAYFQRIVVGAVLPCTLGDVLEDLRYLENF